MIVEFDGEFIRFDCECGQMIKVPAEQIGAVGSCRACGEEVIVPIPPSRPTRSAAFENPDQHTSPHHRRDLEGSYSEADLITYPDAEPLVEPLSEPLAEPAAMPHDQDEPQEGLLEMRAEILMYPFVDKRAQQIFFTGVFIFSPMIWWLMIPARFIPLIGILIGIFMFLTIVSLRLMYFSYLLLVIEKSAEGNTRIPELPVFTSWKEDARNLLKVIGVSVIAFSPYLLYGTAVNMQIYMAGSSGAASVFSIFDVASAGLGVQMFLYATAAFYMPMVLMALVVTGSFARAVNPVFIFRSIWRVRREYLTAMALISVLLSGALALLAIIKGVLADAVFAYVAGHVLAPTVTFYAIIITMHVMGLLYYRNGRELKW